MKRIICNLKGGDYVNVYQPSIKEAENFIKQWRDRCLKALETGDGSHVTYVIYGDDYAILGQEVIAMYIPVEHNDNNQERITQAIEKLVSDNTDGETWKNA